MRRRNRPQPPVRDPRTALSFLFNRLLLWNGLIPRSSIRLGIGGSCQSLALRSRSALKSWARGSFPPVTVPNPHQVSKVSSLWFSR